MNVLSALWSTGYNAVGYDCCPQRENPATTLCTNYAVPRASDPKYVTAVMQLIAAHRPSVIIPTNDHDLRKLISMNAELVKAGVTLNGFSVHTLEFLDKLATTQLFSEHGIVMPEVLDSDAAPPYVLRKRMVGTGKKFTHVIRNRQFNPSVTELQDGIFTRCITGKEFTIDVLCDQQSNVLSVVPRLRHEVHGETVVLAEVVADALIISRTVELAVKLHLTGINCVQCMRTDDEAYFFEVNPRPGSGLSLTVNAGVNMPALWMMSLDGMGAPIPTPKWGLRMRRYYEGFYF